ncbi:hypothetical protein ACFVJH_38175 [Streptomyces decoyicus]|uniref:MmyB family transcriptional regulator n=1 Tax=Streptomyces decoyicus TaxID=249567 RepID=UPI00362C499B
MDAATRTVHSVGRRRRILQRVGLEAAALQRPVAFLAHRGGLPGRLGGGLLRNPVLPRLPDLAFPLLFLLLAFLLAELIALRFPAPPRPEYAEPVLREALLEPQASCLTDLAYNIRSHNDQFATLLPHAAITPSAGPRPNLLRATPLRPQASQWADNSAEWTEELTAELIEAVSLHPDNRELLGLHEEVAADPVAGPVYADAHRYTYPDRDSKVVVSHSFPELNTRQVILISS